MRYVIFHNPENTEGAEWWPEVHDIPAKGGLYGRSRRSPGDTWGPPRTIAKEIILRDARVLAINDGLTIEQEVQ